MENLDIIQKVVATLYFAQITFLFLKSLLKRKKITLGSVETTILPGLIGYYLLTHANFISTGRLALQVPGLILFVAASIFGAITFPHLGYANSDDFWFGRKQKKQRYLVTTGPYAYIRHPIFVALILQYFGLTLVFLHPATITLWLFALLFGIYTSINEEKFMTSLFSEYKTYITKTGRFFPKRHRL